MNVSPRLVTPRYFWHWTLIPGIRKLKLLEEIKITPTLRFVMASSAHSHALWFEECAREVSSSNGRTSDEIQMAIGFWLFRRYINIFANVRWTYRQCFTSLENIIRREWYVRPEATRIISRNGLIIYVRSLALGAAKFTQERFADWSTRLKWRNSDCFWFFAMCFAASCRIQAFCYRDE